MLPQFILECNKDEGTCRSGWPGDCRYRDSFGQKAIPEETERLDRYRIYRRAGSVHKEDGLTLRTFRDNRVAGVDLPFQSRPIPINDSRVAFAIAIFGPM